MKALTLMAALAASTLSVSATAQVILQPDQRMVDNFTNVARKALPMAVLPDGSNVPAETVEELAQPLVPAALDMQTVKRGMLAAEMTLCGLDWGTTELPALYGQTSFQQPIHGQAACIYRRSSWIYHASYREFTCSLHPQL